MPIFYFNCEHVLIVNIEKQRKKIFADFLKKNEDFQNSFIPCCHVMSYTKFGLDRFSRFGVYWTQMDRQTDKLNLYIDIKTLTRKVMSLRLIRSFSQYYVNVIFISLHTFYPLYSFRVITPQLRETRLSFVYVINT